MPEYCLVKHRISTYVIDGADADRNPDRVPVTGVVTFEALLDKGDSVVVTEDGVATTITLAAIEARITNGELWHRGEEGVKLFAGGPDTNPERIRYRAKFSNLIAGGKRIELKDVLFEAIPGGELTLSMAQPVPGAPYPGYSATIEAGIAEIWRARDEALVQVAVVVPDVVQARNEAQAAAGRAEAVADSVYWQDDRLSVMGQLGPSLRGPKGDPGDGSGDGAGDVLWSELNPVLDGKAPVSHQHSWGDVTGKPDTYPPESHTHAQYAESSRVTALEDSQPIIVSSLPSSPLPGRIYLVTG